MIWDSIRLQAFVVTYESYLLALDGALVRSTEALKRGDAATALRVGQEQVLKVAVSARDGLMLAADQVMADAINLGWEHAQPEFGDPVLLAKKSADLRVVVGSIFQLDANKAQTLVRQQALTYDQAVRVMGRRGALLKATGELGDTPFTQLDKRGRQFNSTDLAAGHAALHAAQGYKDAFVEGATSRGVASALLRNGPETVRVDLREDLAFLKTEFHPNTGSWLELPA